RLACAAKVHEVPLEKLLESRVVRKLLDRRFVSFVHRGMMVEFPDEPRDIGMREILFGEPPHVFALLVEIVDKQNGAPYSERVVDSSRIIAHDDVVLEYDLDRIDVRSDYSHARVVATPSEVLLGMVELYRQRDILVP